MPSRSAHGRSLASARRSPFGLGDVGIWHETYLVRAGGYETIYGGMPRVGLAVGRRGESAAERVGR